MNRHTARETAFTLLFQVDINDEDPANNEELNEYTKRIISGVIENKDEIDKIIKENLVNWTYDRVGLVEKTILRISTYEIMFLTDIPEGVSINEAVELAHKYGDDKSSKFINGVLSKIIN